LFEICQVIDTCPDGGCGGWALLVGWHHYGKPMNSILWINISEKDLSKPITKLITVILKNLFHFVGKKIKFCKIFSLPIEVRFEIRNSALYFTSNLKSCFSCLNLQFTYFEKWWNLFWGWWTKTLFPVSKKPNELRVRNDKFLM